MRTRIKFCGLRSPADLEHAERLAIDAVGFVFHPRSPRAVRAAEVATWLRDAPPWMQTVFLFMDAVPEHIQDVLDHVRPDYLQFHGQESAQDCARYGLPWIKAVPMGASPADAQAVIGEHRRAALLLADSHGGQHRGGGTGATFDWARIAELPRRTLIAGGLHADNVAQLVKRYRPWGVDVSSGIEDAPGLKSARRMEAFAAAVRSADAASI